VSDGNVGGTATAAFTITVNGGAPALTLSKSVDRATAAPGDLLVYTLTYQNTGSGSATGVTITDAVPANTTFVSATGGGVLSAGSVTWAVGSLAGSGSGSVTLTVQVNSSLPCSDDDRDSDNRDSDNRDSDSRRGQSASCTVTISNQAAIDTAQTDPTPSNTVTTTAAAAVIGNRKVTGGGRFDSPAGAYQQDAGLTGKANFGFNAQHYKGQPRGQTEFEFRSSSDRTRLKFHSTSYNSLVVSGATATWSGSGRIDKMGGSVQFQVSVVDGRVLGSNVDRFRIRIWNGSTVIYDNEWTAPVNAAATSVIDSGNITIH
jgi:uncharacterized repeat protein (TIGR01451 family)